MPLYHKYRPQSFDEIVGNRNVVATLKADLEKEDKPHAFLLTGDYGCGKTTIGRLIAKGLGAKGIDFKEVDSADFRGIDTIRDMRKQSHFQPLESDCRVWLLDEVHKTTNDAQNALLKALEDTPQHVYYILCTTDPEKLIKTVRSRCAQYQVTTLNDKQMSILLRRVVRLEGATLDQEISDQIILDSQGHPRDALQILDQVLGLPPEQRLEAAKRQAETQSQVIELCRALTQQSPWKKVAGILSGLKDEDNEKIRRAVLGYSSAVLMKGADNVRVAMIMEQFKEPFFNSGFPGLVFASYSVIKLQS